MGKANEADKTNKVIKKKKTKVKSDKGKTKKAEETLSGRIYLGVIVCVVTTVLVVLFFTLGFSVDKVLGFGITELWQAIFVVAPHSSSLIGSGMWSIIAALTSGGFIAGLGIRSLKKAIIVGIISLGVLMLLQLALGFLFDFTAYTIWYSLIPSLGGNIFLDFSISAGILMAAGALGGALTSE